MGHIGFRPEAEISSKMVLAMNLCAFPRLPDGPEGFCTAKTVRLNKDSAHCDCGCWGMLILDLIGMPYRNLIRRPDGKPYLKKPYLLENFARTLENPMETFAESHDKPVEIVLELTCSKCTSPDICRARSFGEIAPGHRTMLCLRMSAYVVTHLIQTTQTTANEPECQLGRNGRGKRTPIHLLNLSLYLQSGIARRDKLELVRDGNRETKTRRCLYGLIHRKSVLSHHSKL